MPEDQALRFSKNKIVIKPEYVNDFKKVLEYFLKRYGLNLKNTDMFSDNFLKNSVNKDLVKSALQTMSKSTMGRLLLVKGIKNFSVRAFAANFLEHHKQFAYLIREIIANNPRLQQQLLKNKHVMNHFARLMPEKLRDEYKKLQQLKLNNQAVLLRQQINNKRKLMSMLSKLPDMKPKTPTMNLSKLPNTHTRTMPKPNFHQQHRHR